jgi:hypothetical protein
MSVRSSALANTYLLPQQPQQQAPTQPEFQDEVGPAMENLQHVDGVTSQYFDKWSALKGFARDVWENYGIDVRYPDPSVPESNRLHRIYLKSIADLKTQGNKLKTSQSGLMASQQRGDIMTADSTKTAYADMKQGTDVIHKTLDPIVDVANQKLRQQYYDEKSLGEAEAYYEDVKGRLLEKAETDPQNSGYWLRQVDALTPPTSAAKQFAPHYPRESNKKDDLKMDGNLAFLKERSNLLHGLHKSYKLSEDTFGPNGERVMVSKTTAGEKYGEGQVVEMQYLPETKETYVKVKRKEGKDWVSELIPLTGTNEMEFAKQATSDNPRLAGAGVDLDAVAAREGLFEDSGELNPTSLLDKDSEKIYASMNESIKADAGRSYKRKTLDDELAALKSSSEKDLFGWTDDRVVKKNKQGQDIKIVKKKDGYAIENIKELLSAADIAKLGKTMTKQKLLNFLVKQGALDQGDEVSTEAAPAPKQASGTKPAPSGETDAQRILREYREKKK